eukprot:gnl/MRDRNA2_/MRDRNA2_143886_c0_seq1.p1 gnl/MRDRNA2_/MRDRNA2_143886_c0~~gnl/MRDRNA2_/MRDRNA2_143886_c0_seq1.p1  ORF type:complete len:283 (+),score=34.93 gnl/MRDRNA2_/MRDRNA2_143886_c0_seq1:86-850(+)
MPKTSSSGSGFRPATAPGGGAGWSATGVLEHNPYRLDIVEAQTGDRNKLLNGSGKRHFKGSAGGGVTTMLSLDGSQPPQPVVQENPKGCRREQRYSNVRAENLTLQRTHITDHDEGPLDQTRITPSNTAASARASKTIPMPVRAKNLTLARDTETRELLHGVPTPTRSQGGYPESSPLQAMDQPGVRRRNDELRSTTLENVFIGPQGESQPKGPHRPERERMAHARYKYIDGKPQYEKDFLASRQSGLMNLRQY